MPDKVWFMRRLNLFEGMSEAEVDEVSRELKMRACAPRTQLIDGGGDRVYLLKHGRIRLYNLTVDGRDVTTAVLVPGQLFGLGAFLGGAAESAAATHAEALEESYVCEAGAHDFLAMLARHPVLMARVLMVMARQMFRLEQTIESMASRHVPERLAALLADELAEGRTVEGGVILPAHTQKHLAILIGSTRESVSRTLGGWRDSGLIATRGRRIVVRDRQRLLKLAGSADASAGNHGETVR